MNNDYTFISELNNMPSVGARDHTMQQFQQQMLPQQIPQQMLPQQIPQQMLPQQLPLQANGMDQFAMINRYLAEDESDSDNDSDYEDNDDNKKYSIDYFKHIYSIIIITMLAVIMFFVIKLQKDFAGMYEES